MQLSRPTPRLFSATLYMDLDGQTININTIKANIRNFHALTPNEMLFLLYPHATEEEVYEIMLLLSQCMEVLQRNMTELLLSSPRK